MCICFFILSFHSPLPLNSVAYKSFRLVHAHVHAFSSLLLLFFPFFFFYAFAFTERGFYRAIKGPVRTYTPLLLLSIYLQRLRLLPNHTPNLAVINRRQNIIVVVRTYDYLKLYNNSKNKLRDTFRGVPKQ